MLTVRGFFRAGRIEISIPEKLKNREPCEVFVTFVEADEGDTESAIHDRADCGDNAAQSPAPGTAAALLEYMQQGEPISDETAKVMMQVYRER